MSELYKYQCAFLGKSNDTWIDSVTFPQFGSFEELVDNRPTPGVGLVYRVVPAGHPEGDPVTIIDIK